MPEVLKVEGKMNVHIISPTRVVLDGVADKIILPTPNGPMMVMKNRAPLFQEITNGDMWVYNEGEDPVCYAISQGIAEIRRNICSVLAWGTRIQDIDYELLETRKESTLRALETMQSKIGKKELEKRIEFFDFLLKHTTYVKPPQF